MGIKINKKISKIPVILGWVLLAILAGCLLKIGLWENNYYKTKSQEERAPSTAVLTDITIQVNPSETKPSDELIKAHQVEADMPRYLDIPRLNIHARIYRSPVNEHSLATPSNIYDSMWYSGSARPGQGRSIIISGLQDGNTQDGIFKNLDSLEKDDEIIIETGAGQRYIYAVSGLELIKAEETKEKLISAQEIVDNTETVSLVTATRSHSADKDSDQQFSSVAIVKATLKSSKKAE